MRRTSESTYFPARLLWHGLTANGWRLWLWQDCGELAAGKRGVRAVVRAVAADLKLSDAA